MDRRTFIAVGATTLLAGCDSDDDQQTDTPTDEGGEATDAPGGGEGTPTAEGDDGTLTPSGDFDATVTFQSCTEFTVESESFSTVFAALAGGDVQEWNEGYSGSASFEANSTINSVTVFSDAGSYEAPNPNAGECREGE